MRVSSAVFRYTREPPRSTAWEAALGLTSRSRMARMSVAQAGLPTAAFERFAKVSSVPREALATTLHVTLRTVQRRQDDTGRLSAHASERLVRLAELYARASEVIGSDALAKQWMQTPREVFGGRTPFGMAGSELGAREVEDLLLRVEHGVFY